MTFGSRGSESYPRRSEDWAVATSSSGRSSAAETEFPPNEYEQGTWYPCRSMIEVKRVYEPASKNDGFRLLVDRLWPRGLSKERAKVDLWMREISPSTELRKWYSHDPRKWDAFRQRYAHELGGRKDLLDRVRAIERHEGTVTLLFSAKETRYNNAVALKMILEARGE